MNAKRSPRKASTRISPKRCARWALSHPIGFEKAVTDAREAVGRAQSDRNLVVTLIAGDAPMLFVSGVDCVDGAPLPDLRPDLGEFAGSNGPRILLRFRRSGWVRPPGEGIDRKLPQRDEIGFARRGAPPGEADRAAWFRRGKARQLDPFIPHFGVDRDLRHKRHAIAVGDHLHDGRQAGRAEAERHVEMRGRAIGDFIKDDPPLLYGITHTPRLTVFGGGFPVVIKAEMIGAIGLSGGHYTQDMECARAALAAIGADPL
jgi:hypothetical protein